MLYKKVLLIAVSFCFSIAGFAQINHNWTGFYIGPNLGGANNNLTIENQSFNPSFSQISGLFVPGRGIVIVPGTSRQISLTDGSVKKTSFTGGIQFGYMKQYNQWAVGLEADFNYSSIKGTTKFDDTLPATLLSWRSPYGFNRSVSQNLTGSLRAKFGYVTKQSLIYLTVGAFAGIKTTIADYYISTYWAQPYIDGMNHPTPAQYNFVTSYNKETKHPIGLTLGVGYDYIISDNISLGIEYRFSSVSKLLSTNYSSPSGGASNPDSLGHAIGDGKPVYASIAPTAQKVKATSNQVTLRLNISLDAILNGSKNKKNTGKSGMKK